MKISIAPYTLNFKFDAGTSRGVLKTRKTWFIRLENSVGNIGIGEVAPLKGLSKEGYENFEPKLIDELNALKSLNLNELNTTQKELLSSSTLFALESALSELTYQQGQIYENDFFHNKKRIPINGLIWMGDLSFMKEQIKAKIDAGFRCLKMKIGAIGFDEEYKILTSLREEFSADVLTLRVDANGAFDPLSAHEVMKKLDHLTIHSIEQPIESGQPEEMKKLCATGYSTGIALDEELIGIRDRARKKDVLKKINPQYIILKPTLHGGLSGSKEWIELAEERKIKWWMTSALESNVGLNAICQFAASFKTSMYQGLGTGSLYHNNIPSPLYLKGEYIGYDQKATWDLSALHFTAI